MNGIIDFCHYIKEHTTYTNRLNAEDNIKDNGGLQMSEGGVIRGESVWKFVLFL